MNNAVKLYVKSILVAFAIVYPVLIYLRHNNYDDAVKYLIPLFVFFMVVNTAGAVYGKIKYTAILLPAFLLILCGDILINLTPFMNYSPFLFFIAHVLLIWYFLKLRKCQHPDLYVLLPFVIFSVSIFFLTDKLFHTPSVRYFFALYLCILTVMVWRGSVLFFNKRNRMISFITAAGSVFFYTTDIFSGIYYLTREPALIFLIWFCYPPALLMISMAGLIDEILYKRQGK